MFVSDSVQEQKMFSLQHWLGFYIIMEKKKKKKKKNKSPEESIWLINEWKHYFYCRHYKINVKSED